MTEHNTTTKEMRMHPRWQLKSTVSVFIETSKDYLGLLVDCSEQGLMISTYDSLEPGTLVDLEIVDVPANVDERRTGHCKAEVVWSDKITPSLYGNGFRLKESCSMFNNMINSYAKTSE
ncbi:MAG: PilZ domain-containing protein [Venatoribacter sp.]